MFTLSISELALQGQPYLNFINSLMSLQTKYEYRKALLKFLSHYNTTLESLLSITPKDIEQMVSNYITNMNARGLSNGYINLVMCAILHFFDNVYELPFNEKNLKALFDKRITPEDAKLLGQKRIGGLSFSIKDERTGVVRDVRDATGIEHKTLELFSKQFDYLANEDYLSPQQMAEASQRAIDMGLLPREAQIQQAQQGQGTKPPSGTYDYNLDLASQ